jgi:hypothetical protein
MLLPLLVAANEKATKAVDISSIPRIFKNSTSYGVGVCTGSGIGSGTDHETLVQQLKFMESGLTSFSRKMSAETVNFKI